MMQEQKHEASACHLEANCFTGQSYSGFSNKLLSLSLISNLKPIPLARVEVCAWV